MSRIKRILAIKQINKKKEMGQFGNILFWDISFRNLRKSFFHTFFFVKPLDRKFQLPKHRGIRYFLQTG